MMLESNIKEPSFIGAAFRWLLMIPASVIGYIAVFTITFWVSTWTLSMFTTVPELARVPASGIAGAAFILVGVATAPLYRGYASIALFSINAFLFSGYLVLFLLGYIEPRPLWEILVEFILGLVGAGYALYKVITTLGWDRLTDMSRLWREFGD